MKKIGRIFAAGLMMAALVFSGCKPAVEPDTGNEQSKPDSGNTTVTKECFPSLTENTAHPLRYVVDFADLVDYVKGNDENVSADGTLTVAKNEQYGEKNKTDRQTTINVEKMFKNNLPKSGDIIELHGKFTSDIDIDNMIVYAVDNSAIADFWTDVTKKSEDVDKLLVVSKTKKNEFKYELPVINDCLKSVAFTIAYGKHNGDGACAKLKFEHCTDTDAERMDSPVQKPVEVLSGNPGIKLVINTDAPEDAVACEVCVYDAEDTSNYYIQEIDKDAEMVKLPYLTAGENYYIKLKYFDADSNSIFPKYMLRVKAESGEGFEQYPNFPKTYEVDLTEYLGVINFGDDGWSWYTIDGVDSEEFYGGVLKKGDRIEYTVTGMFSADVSKLTVQGRYPDSNGDWQLVWNDWEKPVEITAGEEVTIRGVAACERKSEGTVIINISSDELKNGYFVPKGKSLPKTYEVDLTEYMISKHSNYWGSWSGCDWCGMTVSIELDTKEVFGELPQKGAIFKYTFTGKFSTDIDALTVMDHYEKSPNQWITTWAENSKKVEIRANEEVTISGTAIFENDAINTFYINLIYKKEYGECFFIPKDFEGEMYTVALTEYLEAKGFNIDSEVYYLRFDGLSATELFGATLKKGDIISYSFTGKFPDNIDKLDVVFEPYNNTGSWYSLAANWSKEVEIEANKYATISGTAAVENDSNDEVSVILRYSNKLEHGYFIPYGWEEAGKELPHINKIYEVDLTEYMNALSFDDWGGCYGSNGFDITDAFDPLPEKGDMLRYSFSGMFTADIPTLCIYDSYENPAKPGDYITVWSDGWNKEVNIKAYEKVTLSGNTSFSGNPNEDKVYIRFQYPKEVGGCMFIPEGYAGKTYEIDFTPYLKAQIISEWSDEEYGHAFGIEDVPEFELKYPLKKGDLVKFSFTGTFDKDISNLTTYLDGSENGSGWGQVFGVWRQPVEIKAGEEVTISRTAICVTDLQLCLCFDILYPKEYGEATFTPKRNEMSQTVTTSEVVEYIQEIPKGTDCNLSVKGYMDSRLITKIEEALDNAKGISVYLDLSGTTGLETLDDNAFSYCQNLTGIVLPDNLTRIGDSAFYCCENLASANIPDTVEYIGGAAFHYCRNLTRINIPASVTEIGTAAFSRSMISEFYIDSENSNYSVSSDKKTIFSKDGSTLVCCPTASGDFVVPDGVTTIGGNAFYNCPNLTSVILPGGVERIEFRAFIECENLVSVNIPASVVYIGIWAFRDCESLAEVEFEDPDDWYIGSTLLDLSSSSENAENLKGEYEYSTLEKSI